MCCPGAARAEEKIILIVGDSLSAGYGIDVAAAWPNLLQKRLESEGYPYKVINASISGDTSRGGLARLPRLLARHDPCLVLLELGANDGLRGIEIAEIERNFQGMLDLITAAGAQSMVFEMRVLPNYGPAYAAQFDGLFERLAAHGDITMVPFFLHNVVLDRALMQDDGLHPNAAAQARMLDNVWVYLVDLLSRVDE